MPCYEFWVILQCSLWMHSGTWEMKTDENYLTWVLLHSSWKERDGSLEIESGKKECILYTLCFFILFIEAALLQYPGFKGQILEILLLLMLMNQIWFVLWQLIAFLISHVSLSYQKSNYKIQSPAFPAIQGSSALQFVLMSSVLWIHPCNFILAESLSHYPFLGTVLKMYLPLEVSEFSLLRKANGNFLSLLHCSKALQTPVRCMTTTHPSWWWKGLPL